ncbi:MAG: hypothetical protein RLZZ507_2009 [Cyanobacteriota bacterium]|jgi:hypothetical protein
MSVLKTEKAIPSRIQAIFKYLLHQKQQREKRENLEKILSPDKLVEGKYKPRPMFTDSLQESIKCGLLIRDEDEIAINPELPENARSPVNGYQLLPDTLAHLLLESNNKDEEDFGIVCAWFLAQDIYESSGKWKEFQYMVTDQGVSESLDLKMSSGTLAGQMDDWMCYLGFAWGHALGGTRIIVPDPTAYLKRNLKHLFNPEDNYKIPIHNFIDRLAKKCPLFETGKFRDIIEDNIGYRKPNYLSTSTAFALFRLQYEGYIQLIRESDADLILLPKANNEIDDSSKISHIVWKGEKS